MLVKNTAAISPIHGIGVFAAQFIPKGTAIWRFTPGFDCRFTKEEILLFPELLQVYLCKYAWKSKKSGLYCFASDNAKYFNHSKNANTISEYREAEEEVVTIATSDIQPGEELTGDYADFEDEVDAENVFDAIAKKYNLSDEIDPRLK